MPCLDPPEYAGMESVQITQNTTNTTHQQPDVDMCSPFCSCGCCFYAISLQEILFPDFTCKSISQFRYTEFTSLFSSSCFTSFWQPPKLG